MQSVDQALCAVGQTIQMAGLDNPTKVVGGGQRIIQLHRMMEAYQREDPTATTAGGVLAPCPM